MRKLFILLFWAAVFVLLMSDCKKSEVSPSICYMIVTDVTTVHGEGSPLLYETHGVPQTVNEFKQVCDISVKDVISLMKSLDGMSHPSVGICIVRESHYYKIKK